MQAALEFIGPHLAGILVSKIILCSLSSFISIHLLQSKFNEEITVEKVKQLLTGLNYTEVIHIVR